MAVGTGILFDRAESSPDPRWRTIGELAGTAANSFADREFLRFPDERGPATREAFGIKSTTGTSREALAAGLLDEIVAETSLTEIAIQLIHRWTQPGTATAVHLQLLRPPLATIERAFAAETEAARIADEAGLAQAGISRFAARRKGAPG